MTHSEKISPSYRNEPALVLVSGGQDSTTCLVWALKNFASVYSISFDYNQKHSIELEQAKKISEGFGVPHKVVDLSFMQSIVTSNLFKESGDVNLSHELNSQVPSSFVPYRNLLFLTVAAGWASTLKVRHLVTGVCETDFSGYADCRDVFVKSAQVTLNLATDFKDQNVVIHTPLMWLTKCEEFLLAQELGALDLILKETMTCYNGSTKMNDYGMGCGECPSCRLRQKGFQEFQSRHRSDV